MNRHELARLGQYFKDTGCEGGGHGVAADASNNVLEGIGAVILKFAAAPDNLPKDAETEWLRQREADALKLLHAAFGEYACMIKAHLSEQEIFEFEKNFAAPARAFIGAKRFGR